MTIRNHEEGFFARTRAAFERLQAIQFAAPWRTAPRRTRLCLPGQA